MLSGLRHAHSTASHGAFRRFQVFILSLAAKISDFLISECRRLAAKVIFLPIKYHDRVGLYEWPQEKIDVSSRYAKRRPEIRAAHTGAGQ
jgi:hypothetical protein